MKKKNLLLRIIIVLLPIIFIVAIFFFAILDNHRWHRKVEYKNFKTDYQTIANIVIKEFEETDGEFLSILYQNPSTLSNLSNTPLTKISLTKEEQKCLENIGTISFYTGKGYRLESISVHDGFVTFESLNGVQMITYSYEGRNPRREYPKDNDYKYYFKKASENWYYIRTRSKPYF